TDTQEATDVVLKSFAYENANHDCKKDLGLIKNGANVNLAHYIKACANISSEKIKAKLIATAIAQQLQVARAVIKCFECGEQRRIRKQYPKGQKGSKKLKTLGPHCQKGFRWSNQCRSKYDKDSNPLPKQGNLKGAVWCSAPTSIRTPL
ncbi:GAK6 protein, partial [Erythrocercus mccallii]|nr:GAK6 protein [Erythrocercus mccallii]